MTNKLRFEVFKRDGFKCAYCGQQPPDVVLEVDHIVPRSKGGTDAIVNLLTSCFQCNRGKSDRTIDQKIARDDIAGDVFRLKERKAQLKKFYEYQQSIEAIQRDQVERLTRLYEETRDGKYTLNDRGKLKLYMLLKRFNYTDIADAMLIAAGKYRDIGQDFGFRYMCGILNNWKRDGR